MLMVVFNSENRWRNKVYGLSDHLIETPEYRRIFIIFKVHFQGKELSHFNF